jgi:hypothetical protein
VEQQPFSGECRFIRSSRSGHLLTLRSAANVSAVALDLSKGGEHVR